MFVVACYILSALFFSLVLIPLRACAVYSAVALALVCTILRASLIEVRLEVCCILRTNVNKPQIILLTISVSID
jgi:hypothetical protein